MRLTPLPPEDLTADQRPLYDDICEFVDANFGDVVARRADGALIGPFNGWLHHPQFGGPAWRFNRALWEHRVLPPAVHQLVILVTAAKVGAPYEVRGHEVFALRAGLAEETIAAVAAGERPPTLTPEEGIAYATAAVLIRGRPLPESTYRAALAAFGATGVAEIAFLVACFTMVGATLHAFDG
ncbi:4-carboxymuconolactone decarboxylase [Mycolicibacterium litorale]|nr:4-carboxymuconolactone decarboxylase [Mycolicibacterium litorale]